MPLTFVQAPLTEGGATPGLSAALAYGSNTTAGSFLLALVLVVNLTATISVTDSLANTWTQIGTINDGSASQWALFWANNPTGGACTVTAHSTVSATIRFDIAEYTGQYVGVGGPIAGFGSAIWNTTNQSIGPVATAFNNGQFIAFARSFNTGTAITGADGTVRLNSGTSSCVLEDRSIAAPGSYTSAWTNTNSPNGGAGFAITVKSSTTTTSSISGKAAIGGAGVGGATVAYTGTLSGSATADGSGNYSIGGLPNGTFTLIPVATGWVFTPASSNQTTSGSNITGINFAALTQNNFGIWQTQGVVIPPVSTDTPGQPNVLYEGGAKILSANPDGKIFKMWFGTKNGLCYAESADGLVWTRYVSNPVIANGTIQFYTRLRKSGSTYYLYAGNNTTAIAAYTSTDGLVWTLQNANAVVSGTVGAWDHANVFPADIIIENGTWYLYYTAFNTGNNSYPAGVATSTDGINFTKYVGNPVLNDGIISCNFWFNKVGSTYYGWSQITIPGIPVGGAGDPSDISRYSASSPFGPWTYLGSSTFYRTRAEEGVGSKDGQVADPSLVEANGSVYMYYTATPNGTGATAGYQISCAVANSTTLAQIAQGKEGVKDIPIPWGSGAPLQLVTLVSDTFQRANANPIGGNWTPLASNASFTTAQILSNGITSSAVAVSSDSWWNALSWPVNQWAQATVVSCTGSYVGLSIRQNISGVVTVYRLYWGLGTTGGTAQPFVIQKGLNNSISVVAQSPSVILNVGDKLTACIVGSTVSFYQNGFLMIVANDSSITSGASGLFTNPQTLVTDTSLKNWVGGGILSFYSVPDCRIAPFGPNLGVTIQGTIQYTKQTSSNSAIPPVDSRTTGAPVDSRNPAFIRQNSRTPGTYGPGN